jgi:pyrroline-5-carboxylate reductase
MKKIGVVGCGNMGQAIMSGIISKGISSGKNLRISDIDSVKLERVRNIHGVNATFNNSTVAGESDIVILAVKPQDMDKTLTGIAGSLNKDKIVISVAAGVTIKKISSIIGKGIPVARTMPNMPALIKEGFTAIAYSKKIAGRKREIVRKIFSSLGDVVDVKERDLDAITALSGSGPAYFFLFMEALITSGTKLGIKKSVSKRAVLKTALGSIRLLSGSGEGPATLRKKVTSKGGTTQAALRVFKKRKLQTTIEAGLRAAKKRSMELSGG